MTEVYTSAGGSRNASSAVAPEGVTPPAVDGRHNSQGPSRQSPQQEQPSHSPHQHQQPDPTQPEPARAVEWGLKEIIWPPEDWEGQPRRRVRVVTQNTNGPCSFIAICNILILRGAIVIRPPDRTSVSYEYLASLVGDYLVNTAQDVDLDVVFSILPKTQYGMDLNPLFTGISSFRPGGEGGELKLFDLAGIKLVHGWIADPDSHEYAALSKTEDYDTSMDAIVAADTAMSGQLVVLESNDIPTLNDALSKPAQLSEEEHKKVVDGNSPNTMLIRHWLDSNPTQMTYYGLFSLNDSSYIKPNELVCFFRGSHLSVLYKRLEPETGGTTLYTLVTDRVFLKETSVVWESLVDVDGQSSSFYEWNFVKSTPVGGNFAGQTGEDVARAYDREQEREAMTADLRLAHQLQWEEDQYARRVYAEQRRRQEAAAANRNGDQEEGSQDPSRKEQKKKKKDKGDKGDCIIM
ncbi:hypothetical protein FRC17_009870 [Serendipita sp. 399]|nr:hypothetical protein FRC17_009870 [Serendipita sp. 399]